MNIAIILAGGTGTRLGGDVPKQYLTVNGKPILAFSLEALEAHPAIDRIVIVANAEWEAHILEILQKYGIQKFAGFAKAGESREHSVLNGMTLARTLCGGAQDALAVIQDAARPNLSARLIDEALDMQGYDATLPVVPVPDTTYYSEDGREITQLLDRDKLYAGQTPETFVLEKFYALHEGLSDAELAAVRGACQLAHSTGLRVRLFAGEHANYKITTMVDLEKFRSEQKEKCEGKA